MKDIIKLMLIGGFSLVAPIVYGETYSENTELSGSEPIVIAADAPLELDVAAGATVTVSRVISGAGKLVKKGGGTLILAARNLFEGGVEFADGDIRVSSEGAFGSGRVTFTEEGAQTIWFEAPGATFDNDFLVDAKSKYGTPNNNSINATFLFLSDTVLNGDITFTKGGERGIGPSINNESTVVFNGNIDAPNIGRLYFIAYGRMVFNGWIKAKYTSFYGNSSSSGYLVFNNPENEFGPQSKDNSALKMYCPRIICGAPNVISNLYLQACYNYKNESKNYIDLNGYDQILKGLYCGVISDSYKVPAAPGDNSNHLCVKSEKPALLTLTGRGANKEIHSHHAFADMVSVTLDADPAFTLVLSNRTHSMRGGITVSNGTMRAVNATSFPNMTFLNVSEGANFSLSTSVADAMRSLIRSTIEGTLVLESDAVQNMPHCNLVIGENASLTLPESASVTVRSLTVNGMEMQEGTYGPDEISQLVSGEIKVAHHPWPEIVEPVYVIEVAGGATNRLDEMTVSVTQDGVTQGVAFTDLAPTTGTIRKIGGGVLFSSQGLSDFTGQILVEEGIFAVDDNLQTGPKSATETAEIWVKDGATFLLSGTSDTCGGNKLYLYNKFHLSGHGFDGIGAVYSDLDIAQTHAFSDSEWHLCADITVGINKLAKRVTLTGMKVYMNGYSMKVNTATTGGSAFVFDETSVYSVGDMTIDKGTFLPQGGNVWYAMDQACIAITNNAAFNYYNSKNRYAHNVKLWFTPGGKYKWNSGGSSSNSCVPGDIDINWWNGSVVMDGVVTMEGTSNNKGLDLRGKVSGEGTLRVRSKWLHLQHPANDFTFDLSVAPSTEKAYKDFANGLAVYANGALPLSCRGVTITNGVFQLYDDARFDLPKLEYCAKGETNFAFSCSSDVKGGTLAGLKKTGIGTLTYEVPLAVTGVVEVVEGVLDTDGETLKAGTLAPNAGRIDGDVEVLNGVSCAVASVAEGKIKKLTVNGNVTFAENSKLDIEGIVASGVLANWSEPKVLIEADSINGVPVIDPDSAAAQKHWRVSVSGGVLSVFRTYGTVFSIR